MNKPVSTDPSDIWSNLAPVLRQYKREHRCACVLIDKNGHLVKPEHVNWPCEAYFCKHKRTCNRDHRLILREAIRWGGLFIYMCHHDMTLWCVPVIHDQEVYGAILAGFVKISDEDDDTADNPLLCRPAEVNRQAQALLDLLVRTKNTDGRFLSTIQKQRVAQRGIAESIQKKKAKHEFGREVLYRKQNQLLGAIKISDIKTVRQYLNDVLGEIYLESLNNLGLLKFRMLELFVLISRTLLEMGVSHTEFYNLNVRYVKESEELDSIDDFSIWISDVINELVTKILSTRKRNDKIFKALDYIQYNYSRHITPAEVASVVALSESRFFHYFKERMGVTFTRHVNYLRVEKAKEYLASYPYSISEIVYRLSFYDQSYFTKVFKGFTGITPKEFRQKHHNTNK